MSHLFRVAWLAILLLSFLRSSGSAQQTPGEVRPLVYCYQYPGEEDTLLFWLNDGSAVANTLVATAQSTQNGPPSWKQWPTQGEASWADILDRILPRPSGSLASKERWEVFLNGCRTNQYRYVQALAPHSAVYLRIQPPDRTAQPTYSYIISIVFVNSGAEAQKTQSSIDIHVSKQNGQWEANTADVRAALNRLPTVFGLQPAAIAALLNRGRAILTPDGQTLDEQFWVQWIQNFLAAKTPKESIAVYADSKAPHMVLLRRTTEADFHLAQIYSLFPTLPIRRSRTSFNLDPLSEPGPSIVWTLYALVLCLGSGCVFLYRKRPVSGGLMWNVAGGAGRSGGGQPKDTKKPGTPGIKKPTPNPGARSDPPATGETKRAPNRNTSSQMPPQKPVEQKQAPAHLPARDTPVNKAALQKEILREYGLENISKEDVTRWRRLAEIAAKAYKEAPHKFDALALPDPVEDRERNREVWIAGVPQLLLKMGERHDNLQDQFEKTDASYKSLQEQAHKTRAKWELLGALTAWLRRGSRNASTQWQSFGPSGYDITAIVGFLMDYSLSQLALTLDASGDRATEWRRIVMARNLYQLAHCLHDIDGFPKAQEVLKQLAPGVDTLSLTREQIHTGPHYDQALFQNLLKRLREHTRDQIDLAPFFYDVDEAGKIYVVS